MTTDQAYAAAPAGTPLHPGGHTHRRISWAAVFGGVIVVVLAELVLSTLGAGIGLGTINAGAGGPSAGSLGAGAGIWTLVTACASLFCGGYVAAWLAGVEIRFDGALHGFVTWGIATLLTIYLLSSAIGGIIGGGFSALGGAASAAGTGLSEAAKPLAQAAGVTPDAVQDMAKAYLHPAAADPASMSPQDALKQVASDLVAYARGGADAARAKDDIVGIMAAQQKISRDDAAKQFDAAQARLQQTEAEVKQQADHAARAAAHAASRAAFGAFLILVLGGAAASYGGSMAVQRRLLGPQRIAL